jgi:hypothetical protein
MICVTAIITSTDGSLLVFIPLDVLNLRIRPVGTIQLSVRFLLSIFQLACHGIRIGFLIV